jgi:hypothetical protein
MDYGNAMVWLGAGVVAIAAGAGLLYANFAKWRRWRSRGPSTPQHLSARSYDMRREGQQLGSD